MLHFEFEDVLFLNLRILYFKFEEALSLNQKCHIFESADALFFNLRKLHFWICGCTILNLRMLHFWIDNVCILRLYLQNRSPSIRKLLSWKTNHSQHWLNTECLRKERSKREKVTTSAGDWTQDLQFILTGVLPLNYWNPFTFYNSCHILQL